MFEKDHLTPESLLHLLWLATKAPEASQPIVHLLCLCDECYKPDELEDEIRQALQESHFQDASLGPLVWALLTHGRPGLIRCLGHLLEQCSTCWPLAEPMFRRRGSAVAPDDYPNLARKFEDFLVLQRPTAERERNEAPRRLRRLLSESPARRRLLIQNHSKYRSAALIETLCDESRRMAPADPDAARELARLGLEIADLLELERYGPRIREDLKALAHGFIGNAFRSAQQLDEAESSFRRSRRHLVKGSGLTPVGAELDSLEASYFALQRRFDEAQELLERARSTYEDLGEDRKLARVLIKQAKVSREAGRAEEACSLVAEALPKIDVDREPRLLFCALHNQMAALVDLSRFAEAEEILQVVKTLAQRLGNSSDPLHVRWVEAEIAAGQGRLTRAEVLFQEVSDDLRSRGLLVDLGLVSLQLSLVYEQQGESDRALQTLVEAHALLVHQAITREAEAARMLLADVLAAERLSAAMLESVLTSYRSIVRR